MSTVSQTVRSAIALASGQPAPVLLGPLTLTGPEAPTRITIGGRQLAAIHRLPGGARIIDAMGPDDHAVVWHGLFLGPDAAGRVRQVDALRRSGEVCSFSFGDYLFEIVIVEFQYSYESRGAVISYRIRAEKADMAAAGTSQTVLEAALSDCGLAGSVLTRASASLTAYGGAAVGAPAMLDGVAAIVDQCMVDLEADAAQGSGSAVETLSTATVALNAAIPTLSMGPLSGSGPPTIAVPSGDALAAVVRQAGALAGVVQAAGHINRASVRSAAARADIVTIGTYS